MTAVSFADPSSCFVAAHSTSVGDVIDDVRSECGLLIQGIDWICNKFGFDLIGAIFDKIAGDFKGADEVRMNLESLGSALTAVGGNYGAMRGATDICWTGSDARAAKRTFAEFEDAQSTQGEACGLMARQVGNVMEAVVDGVKLIGTIIGMLADELLSIPIAKVLELILRGAAKIKRWISLIEQCIETVRKLQKLIPELCEMARTLNHLMLAVKGIVSVLAIGAQAGAGSHVDETADAGF